MCLSHCCCQVAWTTDTCVCVCRLQQEVSVLQQQLRESRCVVGSLQEELQVKLTNTHTGEF